MKLLIEERVEFLVIGGYAVIFHGYLRTTADLDVLIRPTEENARRLGRVFQRFAGMPEPPDPARFLQAGKIVRIGNPPARVEVHNGVSAVNYEDAASRLVTGVFDGLTLPFISLADLRANKMAAGRYKDLADLEYLPPA